MVRLDQLKVQDIISAKNLCPPSSGKEFISQTYKTIFTIYQEGGPNESQQGLKTNNIHINVIFKDSHIFLKISKYQKGDQVLRGEGDRIKKFIKNKWPTLPSQKLPAFDIPGEFDVSPGRLVKTY